MSTWGRPVILLLRDLLAMLHHQSSSLGNCLPLMCNPRLTRTVYTVLREQCQNPQETMTLTVIGIGLTPYLKEDDHPYHAQDNQVGSIGYPNRTRPLIRLKIHTKKTLPMTESTHEVSMLKSKHVALKPSTVVGMTPMRTHSRIPSQTIPPPKIVKSIRMTGGGKDDELLTDADA
ncbi:unnamed protein product [Peniophora sp. CBMAI 1063]|nr:unnamed protein product [Peniophora sp. CBMAI 1063]